MAAKRITFNEAALLYCILGEPDDMGGRTYPTVEDAISYMIPSKKNAPKKESKVEVEYTQLTLGL